MRALLQRVTHASVTVNEQVVGQIGQGLLVLLGVGQDDSEAQVKTLADKIVHMRSKNAIRDSQSISSDGFFEAFN